MFDASRSDDSASGAWPAGPQPSDRSAARQPGATSGDTLFIVGRIRRSHGVRGDVLIELYTGAPEVVFASGRRLFAGTVQGDPGPAPPALHVVHGEPLGQGYRVRFAEITDRNAAAQWRDRYLLVPQEELPPRGENELYLHELPGLRVETVRGEAIGEVAAWYELRHGILIEVTRAGGSVLLPYRPEFVRAVDREARRLVVELPEGLVDDT